MAFELVELCDPILAELLNTPADKPADFVWTTDPSPFILRKKLRRYYETPHPIELLCYTAGRIVTSDDVILGTIQPILQSRRNVFRRAWFFWETEAHILWDAEAD